MPNWCSNSVVFSAAEDKLEMIRDLFAEIQQKQEADGRYHLPDFAVSEDFMRDIEIKPQRISFTTRFSPNVSLLAKIADHYSATFVKRYMEMGNGLYGEAGYDYHTLSFVNLDQEEVRKAICYDEQQKSYPHSEQAFEYVGDLLDYLLDNKIAQDTGAEINHRLR
jgi:hypothetical protein